MITRLELHYFRPDTRLISGQPNGGVAGATPNAPALLAARMPPRVRKKTSPAPRSDGRPRSVREDGLPQSVREALGHSTDVHPTIEELYQKELRLRDDYQSDPFGSVFGSVLERDPLAFFGVGSAVVAFLLWAWPTDFWLGIPIGAFTSTRLPAVAAFLVLCFILLLLRRR